MDRRHKERLAYERTRMYLLNLKKKILKLRKRNARELDLDKRVNFLVNADFMQWTNSFARKSVLWDKKKGKLYGAR